MKKTILISLLFSVMLLFGCSSPAPAVDIMDMDSEEHEGGEGLSGTLNLDGSTTVYPVAVAASKIFMERNPGVTITVEQSSSGTGYKKFLAGELDISDATRPPKDAEITEGEGKGMDLQMTVISNDAVVVAVHKDNPLTEISTEDLKKVFFTGEITDWSDLTNGAKTGAIVVYGTDPVNSGTAELFIKKVNKGADFVEGYITKEPTPTIVPAIAADPNGIAYTPIKWIDESVVMLSIDGIEPSVATILDTSYKLSRRMLMVTDGTPEGLARDFINFILSDEGQKIVEQEGFIPIN